jgi:hypothetical protein
MVPPEAALCAASPEGASGLPAIAGTPKQFPVGRRQHSRTRAARLCFAPLVQASLGRPDGAHSSSARIISVRPLPPGIIGKTFSA